jgi:hypothetical protein
MFCYLQCSAQPLQSSVKVGTYRRRVDPKKCGDLTDRPAETVNQDDRHALTLWQFGQPPRERRFDPVVRRFGPHEHRRSLADSAAALPNPEEVAHRVVKAPDSRPVLPRICQSLCRRILRAFPPAEGHQSTVKSRLDFSHECRELTFLGSTHHVLNRGSTPRDH